MEYTIRLKTNKKIAPVIAKTNNDKLKIESAGVDSGLKMLSVCEEAAGAPKHILVRSKNPAVNTAMPAALLNKPRVCSLHLICGHAGPDPLTSDLGLRIWCGHEQDHCRHRRWCAEERWQATRAECDPFALVQRAIGIHSAKALNVESMRFTAFPVTLGGGGGDSILAAVQILTWRFSKQNMAAVEREIILLKTMRKPRTEQWREG